MSIYEVEFWEKVYIAAIRSGGSSETFSKYEAISAVRKFRESIDELI